MGAMFELYKVFLKVYTAFLEKCSDVDAVGITVYKKSLYSFYTASDLFPTFFTMSNLCTINCPIYDQNLHHKFPMLIFYDFLPLFLY